MPHTWLASAPASMHVLMLSCLRVLARRKYSCFTARVWMMFLDLREEVSVQARRVQWTCMQWMTPTRCLHAWS
jgi:hypothetical protein